MKEQIGGNKEVKELAKEKRWQEIANEAEKITDKLGKHIESGIKEVVIALNANGFPTTMSCGGHATLNRMNAPWVDIDAPAPEKWQNDDEKKKEWKMANLKLRQKMLLLMEEFYQDRQVPISVRLHLDSHGRAEAFRFQSMGAEIMQLISSTEQPVLVEAYKKEMNDFGKFLKEKYFKA